MAESFFYINVDLLLVCCKSALEELYKSLY